ncbi:hypothetical protein [Anaeromicropila populeti]|uniref:Uncharacterized protein n=1 Tax=Anaeromicropila populeti TaxID=37658 RepID=A0A1I6JHC9_9FIRM|nr:hypothetical protein [Anaeromicropila populeti]SFR78269.1 hypothetical protein SAMN05661086_01681 [Anaeromicropila populeti]
MKNLFKKVLLAALCATVLFSNPHITHASTSQNPILVADWSNTSTGEFIRCYKYLPCQLIGADNGEIISDGDNGIWWRVSAGLSFTTSCYFSEPTCFKVNIVQLNYGTVYSKVVTTPTKSAHFQLEPTSTDTKYMIVITPATDASLTMVYSSAQSPF